MFRRHPVLAPLTLLYLAGVAWITLGPQPLDHSQAEWVLRVCDFLRLHLESRLPHVAALITYMNVEFAANVVMFVPVGVFFVVLFGRRLWWLSLVICLGMTGFIESIQHVIPGRVSDVRDLISNSLGGLIGVIIGLIFEMLAWRRELQRERIKELEARVAQYEGQSTGTGGGYPF